MWGSSRSRVLERTLVSFVVLIIARALPVRQYDDALSQELTANGVSNVFMIWSTSAGLDALAVTCMDSVFKTYGSRVYFFANALNEDDLVSKGWTQTTLVRYSPAAIMKDTPLEEWFPANQERIQQGKYYFSHVTDMMRFSLIFKHGGLYLDTDVLVVRPIGPDKINRVVQNNKGSPVYECSIVYFSPKHPAILEVLMHIVTKYRPDDWVSAGPKALLVGYHRWLNKTGAPLKLVPTSAWLGLGFGSAIQFWTQGTLRPSAAAASDFVGCEVMHLWGAIPRNYPAIHKFLKDKERGKRLCDQPGVVKQRLALLKKMCTEYGGT